MIVLGKLKKNITHIQIFDNYGRYYLKKVNNGSFRGVLQQFDKEGCRLKNIRKLKSLHKGTKFFEFLYYLLGIFYLEPFH